MGTKLRFKAFPRNPQFDKIIIIKDRPLERWGALGEQRREAIRALRGLEIAVVTTPNFNLFIDQPRWTTCTARSGYRSRIKNS